MIFYYRKSLFKIVFGQNLYNCQPINKIFVARFRTNYRPNSAKKILCLQLNEIEGIRKIPLLESRKYTLVLHMRIGSMHRAYCTETMIKLKGCQIRSQKKLMAVSNNLKDI